jgi:hypothetical protein
MDFHKRSELTLKSVALAADAKDRRPIKGKNGAMLPLKQDLELRYI